MAATLEQEPEPENQGSHTQRRCGVRAVVSWRKPLRTSALFTVTNIVFWFVSLSPCRVVCLLGLCLILLMLVQLMCDVVLPSSKGSSLWQSMSGSWEMVDSGQAGSSGAEAQFTDSWMSFKLFLAETSSFKQQNPGKFCLLVCSLCSFLALLGRYIPGIVISYIIVLGIFLWPLISSHDFGLWLDPVLQKLDFGVGEFLQKIKENHEKRLLQAQAEKESIEADLSSMFPKLDSTVCRELSVSDTEVSEVTWTDNGTFNLSEGNTPQTENSEDLDRRSEEEVFSGGLPEFPSLDNGLGTNGDDDDELSIGLPNPLLQSSKRGGAEAEGEAVEQALGLVQRMAGDVITAAVTAAMQERLESIGVPALTQALAEDTDSEAEDFELLDQSELEQLEGELGLEKTSVQDQPKGSKDPGFFSKLLGRH
ncbi:reticulophagy regulator 1 [Hoplias malabaricus]|uniref:reticulophagy regulator 1 n=1 Tax=Hoplias malabaricus TaxID=27720 RepID=UPI0034631D2A